MNFSESLKKNNDFKIVYSKGKSCANKYLVMYTLKNNSDINRIGISVPYIHKKSIKYFQIRSYFSLFL